MVVSRISAFNFQSVSALGVDRFPTVVVLATGGTIAGAAPSEVQAAYSTGQVGVEQFMAPCLKPTH